jgi:fumarate reductase subunit D
MYRINTNEPFWWALFMAGAGVIGMFLPILILVFGLAIPLGWVPPETYAPARLMHFVQFPLVKLFLLVVVSLTLFHWAHRFRYFLFDLGIHGGRMAFEVLFYGLAIAGTIYTGYLLLALV